MQCEKCGNECERDSVDVGFGVITGPWGCYCCGWSEDSRYDKSEQKSPAETENPDWFVDPCGGMIRKSALADRLANFGISPNVLEGL